MSPKGQTLSENTGRKTRKPSSHTVYVFKVMIAIIYGLELKKMVIKTDIVLKNMEKGMFHLLVGLLKYLSKLGQYLALGRILS